VPRLRKQNKTKQKPSLLCFQMQICSAQGISFTESDCKRRCLQRSTATFTRGHSTSPPRVVGNREVVPPTQQCAASYNIIRQRILVTASNRYVAACAIFSLLFSFLFPRLKRALKGHHHAGIQTIQTAMTIPLCNILESNF